MSFLSEALSTKLIPWSQHGAGERFIVARSKMSAAEMPDGVVLKRRKIIGSRVIIRNRRLYANVRTYKAKWPEANLQELENHKMICVLSGQIDFQIGKFAVQCGEGFFLIVPAGTPHPMYTTSPQNNSFCDLLSINLYPHAVHCFITHWQPHQELPEFWENYLFRNSRLADLFHFLVEEMIENKENDDAIGIDLLSAYWRTLQREEKAGHYINPGPVGRPLVLQEELPNTADFKTELLHYVQAHLNQPLTLDSVARGLYLSRTQFILRVRQETGKSFVQFLTDYRIDEAKVLLHDSDWTVASIAGFLGFKSATYFQSVFKRHTGKTPSEYRASMSSK